MSICQECGKPNPDENKFCGECGSAIRTKGCQQTCAACGSLMRIGGLYADAELTIAFDDEKEARFIHALACPGCGEVRLIVDFDTSVEP
jgi:hypothetical protein